MAVAEENDASLARIDIAQYPWHDRSWSALTRDVERLPHALLFYGPAGLGKNAFALRLTRFLLCGKAQASQACGACQSCLLFAAQSHPDFLWIRPEGDSEGIKVDQIRGVTEFLSFKSHIAARKIVVVSPADGMNVSAANSLLKVLEEPPGGSLLILVASHLARLPATVRSRCARMAFGAPPRETALNWLHGRPGNPQQLLAYAGGAPLAAAALAEEGFGEVQQTLLRDLTALAAGKEDPITCAVRWKTAGSAQCIEWLYRFVAGLAKQDSAPAGEEKSFNMNIIDLMNFLDTLSITLRQIGTGMDEILLVENCLIRWCEMSRSGV